MRTYNFFITVIGALVILKLGLLSLAAAIYPQIILTLGDMISGPLTYVIEGSTGRGIALLAGLVFMTIFIYLFWGNIQLSRRERTVVLKNPLGEVLVSLAAIEDFARVLKGKIEGLRDIKGRVVYTRRGLKVSARITVIADYSIVEVSQNVQDAIRNYIQKTLGIEQDINPTVMVNKVVSRDKSAPVSNYKTPGNAPGGFNQIPYR
jgi:uncharacterized alkaline shock family protein YloU